MIDLNTWQTVRSESSSKGNQLKFYMNGYWIKLDSRNNNEGLAEDFVSKFESCILGLNYVQYSSDVYTYNDNVYKGCYSYNMYSDVNVSFISLRRLFEAHNIPLSIFIKDECIERNIYNVICAVSNVTGIDISEYIFSTLLLDALILNEDRHHMNLGVVKKGINYGIAPCFDNGASLFCTNWTYRAKKSLSENIVSAESVARPFSKFFNKQVDACKRLSAKPLQIDKHKLDMLMMTYHNSLYSDELNNRIKAVLADRLAFYYDKEVFVYV